MQAAARNATSGRRLRHAAACCGRVDGVNISLSSVDPSTMFRYYASDTFAPNGFNWGHFSTGESDALLH